MFALVLLQLGLSAKDARKDAMDKGHPSTRLRDWTDMVKWVREHPVTGVVLVPLSLETPSEGDLLVNFQLAARTPVWVDWKQGAAVMWAPSFHAQWGKRFAEVSKLGSPEDFRDYARRNQIPLFLMLRAGGTPPCPSGTTSLHENASFGLCQNP